MDFLKQWTICICLTLVVALVLSLFKPESSMGRFYKMLISIFVFLSFIYPFADFDFEGLKINDFSVSSQISDTNNILAQQLVKSKICDLLSANNIEGAVVDVYSYTTDDEVTIENIVVTLADEYDTNSVKNMIFDNLSLNVEVVHIGQ